MPVAAMEEGTHLPNVRRVGIRGHSGLYAKRGVYIWPNGNFVTVYTKDDLNRGEIFPREQITYMEFGND